MLNLMTLLLGKFWMPKKRVLPWLSVYPIFAVIMGKMWFSKASVDLYYHLQCLLVFLLVSHKLFQRNNTVCSRNGASSLKSARSTQITAKNKCHCPEEYLRTAMLLFSCIFIYRCSHHFYWLRFLERKHKQDKTPQFSNQTCNVRVTLFFFFLEKEQLSYQDQWDSKKKFKPTVFYWCFDIEITENC